MQHCTFNERPISSVDKKKSFSNISLPTDGIDIGIGIGTKAAIVNRINSVNIL